MPVPVLRSDLKTQLELAQRSKLLAEQRADRFEKQATQLSKKYQAVDLEVYQSLQTSHATLQQDLAKAQAKVPQLQQQLAEAQAQVAQLKQQLDEESKDGKAEYDRALQQLQEAQVGSYEPTPSRIIWGGHGCGILLRL